MVNIIFESHSTTLDNEVHLSSGHNDVELSLLGIKQAKELGERYKDLLRSRSEDSITLARRTLPSAGAEGKNQKFDAIYCSDLQRSYRTAEIAFGNKLSIIKDAILRECNYGDLNGHPAQEVEPLKVEHINKPFPNGESYEDCMKRMKEFLDDLGQKYHDRGKSVLIIGHRATQYGLEHLINGVDLKTLVTTPFKWQPGWRYKW
ncbi:MAG: histidine phosphatase family protein [Patescibacteria group bacterium]